MWAVKTLLCALLLLAVSPGYAATKYITEEMDRHTLLGLDAIYEMDFEKAEEHARAAMALAPEHPLGYFALGSVEFVRYIYDTEQTDQVLIASFEKITKDAIRKGETWTAQHPDDSLGLMYLSSSYGLWSRLLVTRRDWLRAYWYGRKAVKVMRKAVEADPENYDAYMGVGMYDYYTDVYPHFVGALAKIVLRGNRQRGIQTLQLVADKGRYCKVSAQLILVEIYTMDRFGNKNPEGAVEIMDGIRKRYPASPMLHAAQLVSLYEMKRYEQVLEGAARYQKAVHAGTYRPIDAAKGYVILGTTYWALGKLDEAFLAFQAGSEIRLGKQLSRWSVWAMIRTGQVLDLLGRNKEARGIFKKAAAEPDFWGFRPLAKAHMKKRYQNTKGPGAIHPED